MPAQSFDGEAGADMSVSVNAPEGALPENTSMTVSRVTDEAALAAIEAKAGTKVYAAADISFSKDETEIEPSAEVEVQIVMDGLEEIRNPSVVHVRNDGSVEHVAAELVSLDRAGNQKALRFHASQFSVYAVIGGGDQSYTVTVNFYVRKNNAAGPSTNDSDWELINKQIIRSQQIADALDNDTVLIFDPGVPGLNKNQAFEGWWRANDFTEQTVGMSVDDMNAKLKQDYQNGTVALERNLYAMVYDVVYITYHDQAGAVLETESLHTEAGNPLSVNKIFDKPYIPFKGDQKFFGWIPASYVTSPGDYPVYAADAAEHFYKADGETQYTLNYSAENNNLQVYPYLDVGYWLSFDNNLEVNNDASHNNFNDSTSASYTDPHLYLATEPTVQPANPTRTGYTFGGWYSDAAMTRAFTWGSKLTKDTTIYAKWNKASTTYRVVFWQQKASDAVDAATKTYDYYDSDVRSAATGDSVQIVTASSGTTADNRLGGNSTSSIGEMGYYFTYDSAASDTGSVQVKGDGSTVLNVYYNRRAMTFTFRSGSATGTTLYTRSGLYGASLSDWPSPSTGYRWYFTHSNNTEYSLSLPWSQYVVYNNNTATTWTLYQKSFSSSYNKYIHWMLMDTDGAGYTAHSYTSTLGDGAGINIDSTLFLGFKLYGYNTRYNSTSGTYWNLTNTASEPYEISYDDIYESGYSVPYGHLYVFYNRNQWNFTYYSDNSEVKTERVYYQGSLSELASYVPTNGPEGYYFDGWYADPGFDTPFDFNSTMPNSNVSVYAKWSLKRYRVVLDYNGGDNITFPGNQADSFRLDYGEQVREASIMAAKREGYILLGWFYRENGTGAEKEFSFSMGAHDEMADMSYATAPASERQGEYQVPGVANPNTWSDVDRPNVRGKITIYAKWREDPEGVIGMHVKYYSDNEVDTGYFAPDTSVRQWDDPIIYVDHAQAYAQPASTPDNTQEQFLYWEILDKEGNPTGLKAYPGQTWEVLLQHAKEERTLLPDPKCDHSGSRTYHGAVAPTCTDPGNSEYWSCDNCGKCFDAETGGSIINPTVPALGHAWGAPSYTWSPATLTYDSGATVTASAVCGRDSSHTVTETVNAVFVVDTPASTSASGVGHYEASFTNADAFTTQSSDPVEIPRINAYLVSFTVANGQAPETQSVEPGSAATLPTTWSGKSDPAGWTFIGWMETDVAETEQEQSFLTGSYTPASDVTLKALYTRSVATGGSYTLVTANQSDWSGNYVITFRNTTALYALKGLSDNVFYEGLEVGGTTPYANSGMSLSGSTLNNVSPYYVFSFAKSGSYYTIQNLATTNYVARYVDSTYGAQLTSLMPSFSTASSYNQWTPSFGSSGNVVLQNYVTTDNTDYPYLGFGSSYFWVDGSTAANVNSIYLWKETAAPGNRVHYATEAAPQTQYTVNFSVPSSVTAVSSQTVSVGDVITLPAAEAPTGSYFAGWSTTALADTTTEPTNYYASGALYKPTANVTLHAVYFYYDVYYALQTSAPSSVTGYYAISSGTSTSSYLLLDRSSAGSIASTTYRSRISAVGAEITTENGVTKMRNVPEANRFYMNGISDLDGYYCIQNNSGLYVAYSSGLYADSGLYSRGCWSLTYSGGKFVINNYYYSSYYMNWSASSATSTSGYFTANSSTTATLYLWKYTRDIHYTSSPASTSGAPAAEEVLNRSGELVQRVVLPVTETAQIDPQPQREDVELEPMAEAAAEAEPAAIVNPDPVADTTTTTVASWDFETSSDYSDWESIDSDGDGSNWSITSTNTTAHGGSYALRSNSYASSTALNPDNWAFTGAVTVPAEGRTTLSFWLHAQDEDWPGDVVRVYANSAQAVSGAAPLTEDIATTAGWVQHSVDLTEYAGQTIYLAFRHYNCTDIFAAVIDDVEITNVITTEAHYHTVRFVDHDNSEIAVIQVEDNTVIPADQIPADPTLEDHYFLAWQTNNSDFDFQTPITGDLVLTAHYMYAYAVTYTVSLRAVYGMVNTTGTTHIFWYANDGADAGHGAGAGDRYETLNLEMNAPTGIPYPTAAETPSGAVTWNADGVIGLSAPDRIFLGWARMETTGAGLIGTAHPELDENDLYLKWNAEGGYFEYKASSDDASGSTTWARLESGQVYADESRPYHDMYAVWASYAYVFHSATGKLEAIRTDTRSTVDLTAMVTPGYLYGGYYTEYGGVSAVSAENMRSFKDSAMNSAFASPTAAQAVTVTGAETYSGASAKTTTLQTNVRFWNRTTAYGYGTQADAPAGNQMIPTVGTVYYLKEVPEAYLAAKYIYTYDTLADNVIRDFYMLTLVDDNLYRDVGFRTNPGAQTVDEASAAGLISRQSLTGYFSITQQGSSDGSTPPVTATVDASSFGLSSGFVAFRKDSALVTPSGSFTLMPGWTTLDGVDVNSRGTLKLDVNAEKTSITAELLGSLPISYSTIYLDTSAPVLNEADHTVWETAGAVTKLYFFGASGEAWVTATKLDTNFYSCEIPSGNWSGVIAVRCAAGSENTHTWDNKWDQTANITLDRSQNLITIDNYIIWENDKKTYRAGYTGVYNP